MSDIKQLKKRVDVIEEDRPDIEIIENPIEVDPLENCQEDNGCTDCQASKHDNSKVKHHAKHKPVCHDKPEREAESKKVSPNVGRKVQYAAYAAVSTTERIIGGLSGLYENIFVGHEKHKLNFDKEQGLKCFDKNNHKNAIDYFLSYLESGNGGDAEVLFLLAKSHACLEEYDKALGYFKKAHKLDGDDPDIAVELAHCLLNLEDYAEAIVYLKQALTKAPDEADLYYHLGGCYEKTEQIEEAKKTYKKAIDLSPREAVYYQALGFVYENSGDHKDAIVCFKKAMDLDRKKGAGGVVRAQRNEKHTRIAGTRQEKRL